MKETKKTEDKKDALEIVVSKYWPTQIVKSIDLRKNDSSSYPSTISFNRKELLYLHEQLNKIFIGVDNENI